jgi:hypothetical protein
VDELLSDEATARRSAAAKKAFAASSSDARFKLRKKSDRLVGSTVKLLSCMHTCGARWILLFGPMELHSMSAALNQKSLLVDTLGEGVLCCLLSYSNFRSLAEFVIAEVQLGCRTW